MYIYIWDKYFNVPRHAYNLSLPVTGASKAHRFDLRLSKPRRAPQRFVGQLVAWCSLQRGMPGNLRAVVFWQGTIWKGNIHDTWTHGCETFWIDETISHFSFVHRTVQDAMAAKRKSLEEAGRWLRRFQTLTISPLGSGSPWRNAMFGGVALQEIGRKSQNEKQTSNFQNFNILQQSGKVIW